MDIEKEGTPDGREQRKKNTVNVHRKERKEKEREEEHGEDTLKNKSTNQKRERPFFTEG